MTGQFRQSVFGRLGGHEDVNDADRLARDLSRLAERVVAFYNHRGTAEPYIKEGKIAIK